MNIDETMTSALLKNVEFMSRVLRINFAIYAYSPSSDDPILVKHTHTHQNNQTQLTRLVFFIECFILLTWCKRDTDAVFEYKSKRRRVRVRVLHVIWSCQRFVFRRCVVSRCRSRLAEIITMPVGHYSLSTLRMYVYTEGLQNTHRTNRTNCFYT